METANCASRFCFQTSNHQAPLTFIHCFRHNELACFFCKLWFANHCYKSWLRFWLQTVICLLNHSDKHSDMCNHPLPNHGLILCENQTIVCVWFLVCMPKPGVILTAIHMLQAICYLDGYSFLWEKNEQKAMDT